MTQAALQDLIPSGWQYAVIITGSNHRPAALGINKSLLLSYTAKGNRLGSYLVLLAKRRRIAHLQGGEDSRYSSDYVCLSNLGDHIDSTRKRQNL